MVVTISPAFPLTASPSMVSEFLARYVFVDPKSAMEAVPIILRILVIRSEEWTDFEPVCEDAIRPTSAYPAPVTRHP